MKWAELFNTVEEFIPLFATLTGHAELGTLAQKLISIGESEMERRMSGSAMTREQVLADAAKAYDMLKSENAALKRMGHENDT